MCCYLLGYSLGVCGVDGVEETVHVVVQQAHDGDPGWGEEEQGLFLSPEQENSSAGLQLCAN